MIEARCVVLAVVITALVTPARTRTALKLRPYNCCRPFMRMVSALYVILLRVQCHVPTYVCRVGAGNIPEELGQLVKLQELDLSKNLLAGTTTTDFAHEPAHRSD